MRFVGRSAPLARFDALLARVAHDGTGVMLAVRGRRQVGKSRLLTEFVTRSGTGHVYFTAVKSAGAAQQLDTFAREARGAIPAIPDADSLFAVAAGSWTEVFTRLRLAAAAGPLVVVLDEFPWACESTPTLEGELQNAWDRHLQHLPILVVLVGSDVTTMERLTHHDRPLYGRAREEVVQPFNPAETSAALGGDTSAWQAFDAHLVTGGYPKLVDELARAGSVRAYVERGCSDENEDLVVVAQRSLDAEFPAEAQARQVLSAIGGHEVGYATFSSVVGLLGDGLGASSVALTRALKVLADQKGVIAIDTPVGQGASGRLRRYRITDPYLRLWFRFIAPQLANIARGRGDVAVRAFEAGWPAWRGVAIEPIVREAVLRLAPSTPALATVDRVGAWWNRDQSVEVDLVAANSGQVAAIGTIKWRARTRLTAAEVGDLAAARSTIPAAGAARLVGVCPAGVATGAGADVTFDAADLLAAWPG